ncbi:MAG TPA: LysR family transcriptional regulator [Bradyrhizobium sp.]|nr:LysR family transcriptional regulator [Bradyrhizobium sp.]
MTPAEFGELNAFLVVSQERSFRRAAVRLKMSPSALSRTIRSLEARLGVRVLNRTTRSVAPTEAGQALREQVQPLVAGIRDAVREVGSYQERPKGSVRINLSRTAAAVAIMPRIADYLAHHPDVRVDLAIDNGLSDVVAKGFDAGIRVGNRVDRDMVAVRLTPDFRMAVVGAPAYFAERQPPATPRDLSGHRALAYRWEDSGTLFPWTFHGPEGPISVEVKDVLTVNDTGLLVSAALDGAGLAFVSEDVVAPHLAAGTLVRALADWCGPVSGFHLYYSSRTYMPLSLRSFIDFMKLNPAR